MNFDPTSLFFSLLFSIIGLAYFSYGRKNNIYFMITGVVLMVYPYFVNQNWVLIVLGVVFSALPFILERMNPLE